MPKSPGAAPPPVFDWAAVARPELTAEQRAQAERYLGLVLEHNTRIDLTADAEPALLLTRHFADGLAAADLLKKRLAGAPRIADLGSGAGFIGMAIRIAWPQAEVTLIEPLTKRFNFLSLAAAALGLRGLRVLRLAASGKTIEAPLPFDAVAFRALAPLPEALRLALPLCKPAGGLTLSFQSRAANASDPALQKSLAAGGARLVEYQPYRLPREGRDRYLALFERD